MSDFIPEREDGKQFMHPSELTEEVVYSPSAKDGLIFLKESLENKVRNLDLSIEAEDAKILAISAVGALAVGGVIFNFDEITSMYGSATQWLEDRISGYINPGSR